MPRSYGADVVLRAGDRVEAGYLATRILHAVPTQTVLPFPTEVPVLAAPPARAPLAKQLAAFEQAVDIGPLGWTDKLLRGRSKRDVEKADELLNAQPRWDHTQKRLQLIGVLALRLLEHGDDRRVVTALIRVLADHACDQIKFTVGEAVVGRGRPKAALEVISSWIEEKSPSWRWQTGARAVLLGAPADAFATLAPRLADPRYADHVLTALVQHEGTLDPRFFEAAVRWLPGEPDAQELYKRHGQRSEVQEVLVRAAAKLAAGRSEPKWGYFYMMLRDIKVPRALPSLFIPTAALAKRDFAKTFCVHDEC